ncbi:hypothetical protein SeD_B0084 (plasmid) [Salmonella enterica subsp. enterica serovar Dublin str. CT_02021853]|uniref:Uncharacterized protein n=2 Tax=Salmonella dublin TaxID=98360 RepID=A0A8X6ERE5_SALDU|nr:hypothetical protein SeD_B0084 [Salmonella enterica subsp. enterica serovar Dublin str. CT_02021853]EGE28004.1 hypothetical protein SD3246_p064 [Salmonella enterica subsp. enterica serovar Dublin str. SD3246]
MVHLKAEQNSYSILRSQKSRPDGLLETYDFTGFPDRNP